MGDQLTIHANVLQRDTIHPAIGVEPLDGTEGQLAGIAEEADVLETDILDMVTGCVVGTYLHGKHLSSTGVVEPNVAESNMAECALVAAHDGHSATPRPRCFTSFQNLDVLEAYAVHRQLGSCLGTYEEIMGTIGPKGAVCHGDV